MRSLRLEERVELLPAGSPAAASRRRARRRRARGPSRGSAHPWLRSSSSRMPRPPARSSPTRSPGSCGRTPRRCSASRPARPRSPVYEALPSRLAGVDVSRVRGFALDEYVGLDPAHPRELPLGDHARGRRAARARPGARARAGRLARGHRARRRGLRARARRGGRRRSAASRHRHRRPHRLQRAGFVVRLADPRQDAHRADAPRQRAVLRLDRRRAAALHHPGARHDPARPAPRAPRVRQGQGRGGRRRGRGPGDGVAARHRRSSCIRTRPWSSTRPRHPICASAEYYRYTFANKPAWQGL